MCVICCWFIKGWWQLDRCNFLPWKNKKTYLDLWPKKKKKKMATKNKRCRCDVKISLKETKLYLTHCCVLYEDILMHRGHELEQQHTHECRRPVFGYRYMEKSRFPSFTWVLSWGKKSLDWKNVHNFFLGKDEERETRFVDDTWWGQIAYFPNFYIYFSGGRKMCVSPSYTYTHTHTFTHRFGAHVLKIISHKSNVQYPRSLAC